MFKKTSPSQIVIETLNLSFVLIAVVKLQVAMLQKQQHQNKQQQTPKQKTSDFNNTEIVTQTWDPGRVCLTVKMNKLYVMIFCLCFNK